MLDKVADDGRVDREKIVASIALFPWQHAIGALLEVVQP